ncbi:acylglycerol kinase family protein [Octadecabacter sp.]|nr:acylglycerol kinase family protein [Octadecabacter sp.]
MKIGLISNPLSRANRKNGGVAAQVTPSAEICVSQPHDHIQLVDDLKRFAQDEVELIVIDGGDGTVRDVVSNIHHGYHGAWPLFAILPSGKTNVIAGEVGHFTAGYAGWLRLVEQRKTGRLGHTEKRYAALEISWPTQNVPMQRGFLMGFAAFADGKRIAEEKLHPKGIAKGLAVAIALGSVLFRNLMPGLSKDKGSGEVGSVEVDGAKLEVERHFLVMASTLNQLTLGMRPFWEQGSGQINWLDISAPPKRLLSGLLLLARGQRRTWMEKGGYSSGRANGLGVKFDAPFVLDGELYETHGHVHVTQSQFIRFVGE